LFLTANRWFLFPQLLEKARGLSLRTFGLANTVVGMLRA
jgi:hypothetical protein